MTDEAITKGKIATPSARNDRKKYLQMKNCKICNPQSEFCNSCKDGFTLLEVLIAIAIIGSLLVTLIYTLNYHLGIAERHETVTIATLLAKSKMADLENSPEESKGKFEAPYENYNYESFVKDSPYPHISEIIVVVRKGKEEVKMNEFIFK